MSVQTTSVCPVCLRALPAQRIERDDALYLEKHCPQHGAFSTRIWSDMIDYERWGLDEESTTPASRCPSECLDCAEHRVRPCCVLLEVTHRCNLGCPVCFAQASVSSHAATDTVAVTASRDMSVSRSSDPAIPISRKQTSGFLASTTRDGNALDPSLETIAAWYDKLYEKAGACHIQLSGGEPTLRDDLDQIIRIGREKGFSYFQLNTNGIRLAEEPDLARRLKDAGLTCVFLQFDATDDRINRTLRGIDLAEKKQKAIDACGSARLPVVLVPTIAGGVNDNEVAAIVNYGIQRSPVVRGVHFQPMSFFGRCNITAERVTIPELLLLLEEQSDRMLQREDFSGGGVENPHCSFNANYLINDKGRLEPLKSRQTSCCGPTIEEEPVVSSCCGSVTIEKPLSSPTSYCRSADDPVARAQDIQQRRWGTDLDALSIDRPEAGSLDEFLWRTKARGFSVTGMAFMDAYTMDFDRLRNCYIFTLDPAGNPIPFCAYNLTNAQGNGLYRNRVHASV
jgi:uncharacterized radical SAM superfamily Fe-S cluster-containing enzyme